MKKMFVAVATMLCVGMSYAQEKANSEVSVERSIAGVQLGLGTLDVYNEARLSNAWALVGRYSLVSGFSKSSNSNLGYMIATRFSILPKYYYNLKRRVEKNKNIANNTGNYLAVSLNYVPNWVVMTNNANYYREIGGFSIVPTYGIRRRFAQNFNYEFLTGLGYTTPTNRYDNGYLTLQLNMKIGYDFFKKK